MRRALHLQVIIIIYDGFHRLHRLVQGFELVEAISRQPPALGAALEQ